MSCNEYQKLEAYADGELPADERAGFEEHLALCAMCARELVRLKRLSAAIGSYRPALSADALDRIHEAVAQTWDLGVIRLARRISAVAAAVVLAGSLYLTFFETEQATAAAPVWEQAAVSAVQPQDAQLAASTSGESQQQVQLAEWIVSDLSANRENASR